MVRNALSIDVEEYFHVTAFNGCMPCQEWHKLESRVVPATKNLLSILAKHHTKATFFVVGWVARKHPGIVKVIQREGHEIACHSYAHREISEQSPESFRKDLRLGASILEDITGNPVKGYRAPSFSITKDTLWALDVLIDEGFRYDSSIFPIHHDRYGIPKAERFPNLIQRNGHRIWEFPMSTLRFMGINIPFSGGGYLRLLPLRLVSRAIMEINRRGQPAIVYVHPWEFDPRQPRVPASLTTRLRHYHNISRMGCKFERLLAAHRFAPISEVLEHCARVASGASVGARNPQMPSPAEDAGKSPPRRPAVAAASRDASLWWA